MRGVERRILDVWEGLRGFCRILRLYGIALLRFVGRDRGGIVSLRGSSGILFLFGMRCVGDRRFHRVLDWMFWAMVHGVAIRVRREMALVGYLRL